MSSSASSPLGSSTWGWNAALDRLVDVGELDADDVAVGVLGDEDEVDHPDHAALHELGERRRDLTGELVAGEPDHQDLDRSDVHRLAPRRARRPFRR